jgi:hypothetical protein
LQCGGELGAAGAPSNRHAAWSRLLLELHPSVIGDSVITKKIISNKKELQALLNPKDRLVNVMGCITELDGLLKLM